jgi:hypothetical protein
MLQKIFAKNENAAVFITVMVFLVFHFGMLLLFKIV